MLWRRYSKVVALAFPVGGLGGVILASLVYFGGNPDYRSQGGLSAFMYLVGAGGLLGLGSAVGAVLGATLILLVCDRRLQRSSGARIGLGVVGSAAGAAAVWVIVGAMDNALAPTGRPWLSTSLMVSGLAALCAAGAAWLMIGLTERRASLSRQDRERIGAWSG